MFQITLKTIDCSSPHNLLIILSLEPTYFCHTMSNQSNDFIAHKTIDKRSDDNGKKNLEKQNGGCGRELAKINRKR